MHRVMILMAVAFALIVASGAGADRGYRPTVLPLSEIDDDTGALHLDAFAGRVVYVDFWASWCKPCRRSFEWMAQMHDAYAARGLVIIAVNVDRDRDRALTFLRDAAPPFTIVFDPDARVAATLDLDAMPSSFLFAPDGSRVASRAGFRAGDAAALEQQIAALLPEKVTP